MLCTSEAEEAASQSKAVKRVCINKFRALLEPFLVQIEE